MWDPACGDGAMLHEFERHGLRTVGTDILGGDDFLQAKRPEDDVSWIITNPPFSLAEEFIFKAQSLEYPFAYLLNSQFWHAARRRNLFQLARPAMVLPLSGSSAPVFDVDSEDATEIGRLRKGVRVVVSETVDGWSHIIYKERTGYMRDVDLQFMLADEVS